MTPVALTEYVPTLATVMVEPAATVQLFGVCAGDVVGLHNRIDEAERVEPVPAVSFVRMFFVCAVL